MPEDLSDQANVDSLSRKLRALESQLNVSERGLLARILGAAALSGIVLGAVEPAVITTAASGTVPTVIEAGADPAGDEPNQIRAQFRDSFTPGKMGDATLLSSVKLPD